MLATMLVRSLCRTFRSPNQRNSQGWEGKEPASAGFLLAVVLVCYPQDKINKSYKLDTTMKINEIATRHLNEAPPIAPVVKYVGPYFDKAAAAAAKVFGVGKGSTQAEFDALRAADTGAVKAAGERLLSTVSKDELNALLYPPVTPKPTVGSFLKRRGDQGFDPDLSKTQALPGYLQNMPPASIGSPPKPKPRPDTSAADREVRKTHDMNPRMPNKGKLSAEAEAYAAEKAARAKKQAAEELAAAERQASGLPADFEPPMSANAPLPALPPAPAATGGRQVRPRRPGQGSSRRAAPQPETDTVTLPRDIADRILRMAERDPAAAQAAAEKAGIPWYIPSKGGLAAGTVAGLALGGLPPAINAIRPGTVPDYYNPVDYITKGPKEVLAPRPLPPSERIPPVAEPETDRSRASSTTPVVPVPDVKARSADEIPDDDPRLQELMRQAEKNGGKLDESTAALNRMVYLSKL